VIIIREGETKINILKRDFSVEKVKSSFSKVAWFYDFWSRFTEEKAVSKALKMAKIKNTFPSEVIKTRKTK